MCIYHMTYKIVFLKNVIQAEIYITNSNSNLIELPALMEHHQHPQVQRHSSS